MYIPFDICYIKLEDESFEPKHVAFKHGIVLQLSAFVFDGVLISWQCAPVPSLRRTLMFCVGRNTLLVNAVSPWWLSD